MWYAFHLGLAAICLAHMGIIIIPMGSLANRSILPLIPTPTGQRLTEVWKEHVDPFRVSNSYGLFRRMTGVGASEGRGYGGLPPSMVEVPAVVLEGSINGSVWEEIPFRYAPFVEERAPRRTAPHQPRLDWQLWFAALGHYQHNPWLLAPHVPHHDAYPVKRCRLATPGRGRVPLPGEAAGLRESLALPLRLYEGAVALGS